MLFSKGNATGNDFVIVDDHHGAMDLPAQQVARVCDRHFGIGGDGLLRVVRAGRVPGYNYDPNLWFMDYRNADGSIAEMCGNGLRLFARHLLEQSLVGTAEFEVATRAGLKRVREQQDGKIAADLGEVRLGAELVTIEAAGRTFQAHPADVGNPHAVCFVDDIEALDLGPAPAWSPVEAFPNGVNVEFVQVMEAGVLRMRVHERGVGETLSCGTGVVAAAAVYRAISGHDGPVQVMVRGGELTATFEDGHVWLTGPAVVVAEGEFRA